MNVCSLIVKDVFAAMDGMGQQGIGDRGNHKGCPYTGTLLAAAILAGLRTWLRVRVRWRLDGSAEPKLTGFLRALEFLSGYSQVPQDAVDGSGSQITTAPIRDGCPSPAAGVYPNLVVAAALPVKLAT